MSAKKFKAIRQQLRSHGVDPKDVGYKDRYGFNLPSPQSTRSRSKRYPQMITAPDGEIRLWNDTVTTRQVLRARIKPWKSLVAKRMWESRP